MKTEINSQTTTDYETSKSQFVEMLQLDGAREYIRDFDIDVRLEFLKKEIKKRVCSNNSEITANAVPNHFVIQQAAERYFSLVIRATKSLHFSQPEMTIILNTTCSSVWQWDAYMSVAGMVADDHGVESLDELEPDSILRLLIKKLAQLSPTENAALVDVCERIWRSQSELPLEELCAELGMPLTE